MANKIILTQEQEAYIIKNFHHKTRFQMASHLGLSLRTLDRKAKGLGLQFYEWKTPEYCIRAVRENFDKMCFRDIDRKFGLSRGRAAKVARRLGLEQPTELKERVRKEQVSRLKCPKDYKAIAAKNKTLRKMDELRISCGLPRKTKFRVCCISKRAYKAKWRLVRLYGYYECEDEPYTVLFDANTNRVGNGRIKKFNEDYYSQKYGLCFEEIEN